MSSYEGIKKFIVNKRPQLIYGVCFVLVFIVGYGTGKASYEKVSDTKKTTEQTNYSKNVVGEPETNGLPPADTTTQALPEKCEIKGNIGSGGKKIYHKPGGAFYEKTKAENCFSTPAEAEEAGFRPASR